MMEKPRIKIESDGLTATVELDGERIKCNSLDFHGDVENGIHIMWSGLKNKLDKDGVPCIENDELVMEEFSYDSNEAVK